MKQSNKLVSGLAAGLFGVLMIVVVLSTDDSLAIIGTSLGFMLGVVAGYWAERS